MGILQSFPPTRAHSLATALLERHSAQEIADAVEISSTFWTRWAAILT